MTETTFPVSTTASDILINLPRNVSDLLKHSIDSSGLAGKVKIETHEYRQTKELIRHGESCQPRLLQGRRARGNTHCALPGQARLPLPYQSR